MNFHFLIIFFSNVFNLKFESEEKEKTNENYFNVKILFFLIRMH